MDKKQKFCSHRRTTDPPGSIRKTGVFCWNMQQTTKAAMSVSGIGGSDIIKVGKGGFNSVLLSVST